MQIIDGTGGGYAAGVDSTNRLTSRSITEGGNVEASVNGDHYVLTTGPVTLTSAASSAVFWFQNEDDFPLYFDRVFFGAGVSTGGTTNLCQVSVTINATALGSGSGSSVIIRNLNFGSSNLLDVSSSEIGQTGATVTGGVSGPTFFFPDKLTSFVDANVYLPKGTGLAFSVTPPAGNTSLVTALSLNMHKISVGV